MAAARAMLPPSNWMMRLGRTGAMMPKAKKSKSTVIRMKTKAARLGLCCGVGGTVDNDRSPTEWEIVAGNERRGQRNPWVGEGVFARIGERLERWLKNTWKKEMADFILPARGCRWIRSCMNFGLELLRNLSRNPLPSCGWKKFTAALHFTWQISVKLTST